MTSLAKESAAICEGEYLSGNGILLKPRTRTNLICCVPSVGVDSCVMPRICWQGEVRTCSEDHVIAVRTRVTNNPICDSSPLLSGIKSGVAF